jgi:GT2 family glycosyltransferase
VSAARPRLAGVVVHWHTEEALAELLDAWPHGDPRFELVVVDNGSAGELDVPRGVRLLAPAANLGFAGGVNLGVDSTEAPLVLVLNADVKPRPGSLDALLQGFESLPDAAGLVPRLLAPDGSSQCRWQLRPLPTVWQVLRQTLFVGGPQGPRSEPAAATVVGQPAAAALALRRERLAALGGLDAGFHPAWFEDVDLARRAAAAGELFRYWPAAVLEHRLGSTVDRLGYGPFLVAYYRNLVRYLHKHHGRWWAGAARLLLPLAAGLRLLLLPLRRPNRARSRAQAAAALLSLARAAVRGFAQPPARAGDVRERGAP